ncbi:MAG: hypothetical protein V2A58_08310 [Planctomycetota bacterium]
MRRMVGGFRPFLGIAAVVALLAARASGDVVEMRNGRSLEGTVVEETESRIVLRVGDGTVSIDRGEILRVVRTPAPTSRRAVAGRLIAAGDYSKAIETLKGLIESHPEDRTLRTQLSHAYARLISSQTRARRYSRARAIAKEAEALRAQSPELSRALDDLEKVSRELETAEQQAKALLAAGRAAEATTVYEGLEYRDPENAARYRRDAAEALLAQAETLFAMRRYDEAAQTYVLLPRYDPALFQRVQDRFVYARLVPITEELSRRNGDLGSDWPSAAKTLVEILDLVPNNPHALFTLGLYRESQRDYREALRLYGLVLGRAFRYEGPVQVADVRQAAGQLLARLSLVVTTEEERELFAAVDREHAGTLTSSHFRVHYYNEELARRVANAAEISLSNVRATLSGDSSDDAWPMLCDIYLHPDQDTYRQRTDEPPWATGVSSYKKVNGELRSMSISTFQAAPALLQNVIPHEVAHTTFSALLGWPDRSYSWIQEGVALHGEPALRREYFARVIRAKRETEGLIPLDSLVAAQGYPDQEEIDVFYAESFYLTEYLLTVADPGRFFIPFAQALSTDGFDTALAAHFGVDRLALARQWELYLEKVARSAEPASALRP